MGFHSFSSLCYLRLCIVKLFVCLLFRAAIIPNGLCSSYIRTLSTIPGILSYSGNLFGYRFAQALSAKLANTDKRNTRGAGVVLMLMSTCLTTSKIFNVVARWLTLSSRETKVWMALTMLSSPLKNTCLTLPAHSTTLKMVSTSPPLSWTRFPFMLPRTSWISLKLRCL